MLGVVCVSSRSLFALLHASLCPEGGGREGERDRGRAGEAKGRERPEVSETADDVTDAVRLPILLKFTYSQTQTQTQTRVTDAILLG